MDSKKPFKDKVFKSRYKKNKLNFNFMSKQCPHCGSYNTETSVNNYVKRGVVNAGRFAIASAAAICMGLFSREHAAHAGVHTYKSLDPGTFNGNHCCNCGKDF